MLGVKSMVSVPIALIVVVIYLVQFIGWVVLSCVCIDDILDGIINIPKCLVLFIKKCCKQGTCIYKNLHFKLKMACMNYNIPLVGLF